MALSGCEAADRDRFAPVLHDAPPTVPLGLVGYNYTDSSISDFPSTGRVGAISGSAHRAAAAAVRYAAFLTWLRRSPGP